MKVLQDSNTAHLGEEHFENIVSVKAILWIIKQVPQIVIIFFSNSFTHSSTKHVVTLTKDTASRKLFLCGVH